MSIISIGNITSKMIYPFLMGIFSFFSLILYKLLRNVPYTKKGGQTDYFHQKPFLIAWVMCLAEASCSFLYFNYHNGNTYMYNRLFIDNNIINIQRNKYFIL